MQQATQQQLSQALNTVKEAIDADTRCDYESAYRLYLQSLEHFKWAWNGESSLKYKQVIMTKMTEYRQRAAVLKQYLDQQKPPSFPAAPSPSSAPLPASSASSHSPPLSSSFSSSPSALPNSSAPLSSSHSPPVSFSSQPQPTFSSSSSAPSSFAPLSSSSSFPDASASFGSLASQHQEPEQQQPPHASTPSTSSFPTQPIPPENDEFEEVENEEITENIGVETEQERRKRMLENIMREKEELQKQLHEQQGVMQQSMNTLMQDMSSAFSSITASKRVHEQKKPQEEEDEGSNKSLSFRWTQSEQGGSSATNQQLCVAVRAWQANWDIDSQPDKSKYLFFRTSFELRSHHTKALTAQESFVVELTGHQLQRYLPQTEEWEKAYQVQSFHTAFRCSLDGIYLHPVALSSSSLDKDAIIPMLAEQAKEEARQQWETWVESWLGVDPSRPSFSFTNVAKNEKVEIRVEEASFAHWGKDCLRLKRTVVLPPDEKGRSQSKMYEAVIERETLRPHEATFTHFSVSETDPTDISLQKRLFVFDWNDVTQEDSTSDHYDELFNKKLNRDIKELSKVASEMASAAIASAPSFLPSPPAKEPDEEDEEEEDKKRKDRVIREIEEDERQQQEGQHQKMKDKVKDDEDDDEEVFDVVSGNISLSPYRRQHHPSMSSPYVSSSLEASAPPFLPPYSASSASSSSQQFETPSAYPSLSSPSSAPSTSFVGAPGEDETEERESRTNEGEQVPQAAAVLLNEIQQLRQEMKAMREAFVQEMSHLRAFLSQFQQHTSS
ncbi:Vacuolar protein sorting-associated protein 4 [Balamuthia mandrillaris]